MILSLFYFLLFFSYQYLFFTTLIFYLSFTTLIFQSSIVFLLTVKWIKHLKFYLFVWKMQMDKILALHYLALVDTTKLNKNNEISKYQLSLRIVQLLSSERFYSKFFICKLCFVHCIKDKDGFNLSYMWTFLPIKLKSMYKHPLKLKNSIQNIHLN